MKKIVLSILSVCIVAISIQAQSAKDLIKEAGEKIKLADKEMTARLLNPEAPLENPMAGVEAFKLFSQALGIAEKKGDIKKAISGISDSETHLNNLGVGLYQAGDYASAFENFDASVKAYELLKSKEAKSRLDEENLLADQQLFAGITAFYSNNFEAALPYYQKLYDAGTEEPSIYEGLYKMVLESDPAAADAILVAGREKFPENTTLLFTEINKYLSEGKLDILIEKLTAANKQEPDNLSVITTLGNVYDQLHVKATEDGDAAKAEEYFNGALGYYNQVIEKEADNFDAWYSSGALYYNKAANMAPKINELANDFSAEGTKQYTVLKDQMDSTFAQALPFFEKAEMIKADDRNTIIALKEIYARQNKFDKVTDYQTKLDALKVEE